ncbi:MAG: hypothetical protein LBM17_00460 [Candidatus Accumulibacter sp.]|jgi:hypothetical protein|nr:hypothetical protein [Accumulibacter sp.]
MDRRTVARKQGCGEGVRSRGEDGGFRRGSEDKLNRANNNAPEIVRGAFQKTEDRR